MFNELLNLSQDEVELEAPAEIDKEISATIFRISSRWIVGGKLAGKLDLILKDAVDPPGLLEIVASFKNSEDLLHTLLTESVDGGHSKLTLEVGWNILLAIDGYLMDSNRLTSTTEMDVIL